MKHGIRFRALMWTLVALGTFFVANCGGDESSSGGDGKTCEPGATRTCVGPGACEGGQQCSTDGRIWGACECGGAGGGGTSAGGTGGGTEASAGRGGLGGGVGANSGSGGVSGSSGTDGGSQDSGIGGISAKCPQGRGPVMVDVGSFCIDATKVTQKHYQEFLDDIKGVVPPQSPECFWNIDVSTVFANCYSLPNHAAACRDWCDAQTFCKWAGKRLCGGIGGGAVSVGEAGVPSKSEWVSACTQGGTTSYPWGNNPTNMCVCSGCSMDVGAIATCKGATSPYDQVYDQLRAPREWINSCEQGSCWVAGGLPCSKPVAQEPPTSQGATFRCCADHVGSGGGP